MKIAHLFRANLFLRANLFFRSSLVALAAIAALGVSSAAYADSGTVRISVLKGGWFIGGSGGSGTLTSKQYVTAAALLGSVRVVAHAALDLAPRGGDGGPAAVSSPCSAASSGETSQNISGCSSASQESQRVIRRRCGAR